MEPDISYGIPLQCNKRCLNVTFYFPFAANSGIYLETKSSRSIKLF
jgi:hypothetical protein